jgi:hypothetical protein
MLTLQACDVLPAGFEPKEDLRKRVFDDWNGIRSPGAGNRDTAFPESIRHNGFD